MTTIKVIDTISVSYDSMEELIERQALIEDKLNKYITEKRIADSFTSHVGIGKDKRFHLNIQLLSEIEN